MHAVINGQELWYESTGTGTPVVLVMGFGMTGKAWRPQVAGLSPQHQVITFDNRGIGRSRGGVDRYTMNDLADDVAGLLDHLQLQRAHIVGVSMGGMISQHVALRHRDRLQSLSLIATHAGGRVRTLPKAKGLRLFFRANRKRGDARLRALLELLYPPEAIAKMDMKEFGAQISEDLGEPPDPRSIRRQFGAILRHDTRPLLSELRGLPTLVVRAGRDILIRPSHSDTLHRLIPGSRLLSFEDGGHAVTAQHAPEVNEALLRHFERAEAPR